MAVTITWIVLLKEKSRRNCAFQPRMRHINQSIGATWILHVAFLWQGVVSWVNVPCTTQRLASHRPAQANVMESMSSVVSATLDTGSNQIRDKRPFASRASRPRPARRLNHPFKYLYRHDLPTNLTTDAMQYLKEYGGYSKEQVIKMNSTFPPLLTLSVNHQLHPKMR